MDRAGSSEPRVPRFSVDYMDRSVDPTEDFYGYATGTWRRNNPVPADKAIWGGFTELIERNFVLLRALLESAQSDASAAPASPRRQVGDFYASALDQARRESVGFAPIRAQLEQIARIETVPELVHVVAALHDSGVAPFFQPFVHPDRRNSAVYAFYVYQGGIGLPDREYYLAKEFEAQRLGYEAHIGRMFRLLGDSSSSASSEAAVILSIETDLARASRSATELRDDVKNHHPFPVAELTTRFPGFPWTEYLADRRAGSIGYIVFGQPEFFTALETLLAQRPLTDLKVYLRWHVLHAIASYLQPAVEREDFEFYHRVLQGQPEPEPDWKLAARTIDENLGEALGALYVERHFPPEARARMGELVSDLRAVFRDRLRGLDWMTEPTRQKALAKFDRFTTKIGHPDRFRDYSSVVIRREDYAGNWQRAVAFEVHRQMARIGGTVDRSEWGMTPQTVNAYFSPTQNEIVFPAGILQPPFFDATMDDAVNYGAIGAVIGHEITHGYDDQGRRFDAEGNLGDWWSEADAREFEARAKVVVDEYSRQEGLPGVFVNGELTLGENIADFGGVSLAYEALQRRLSADPSRRIAVDGLTPEQRFYLSWAQVWRQNCREPERRRRLTVDPHSPGDIRAVTPAVLHPHFSEAFPAKGPPAHASTAPPKVRIW
jgi:putative endopeptidase